MVAAVKIKQTIAKIPKEKVFMCFLKFQFKIQTNISSLFLSAFLYRLCLLVFLKNANSEALCSAP